MKETPGLDDVLEICEDWYSGDYNAGGFEELCNKAKEELAALKAVKPVVVGRRQVSRDAAIFVAAHCGEMLLSRMEKKGDGHFVSSHETLGVICEEYEELKEAVRANYPKAVCEELLDLAVAALFGICSAEFQD